MLLVIVMSAARDSAVRVSVLMPMAAETSVLVLVMEIVESKTPETEISFPA